MSLAEPRIQKTPCESPDQPLPFQSPYPLTLLRLHSNCFLRSSVRIIFLRQTQPYSSVEIFYQD